MDPGFSDEFSPMQGRGPAEEEAAAAAAAAAADAAGSGAAAAENVNGKIGYSVHSQNACTKRE